MPAITNDIVHAVITTHKGQALNPLGWPEAAVARHSASMLNLAATPLQWSDSAVHGSVMYFTSMNRKGWKVGVHAVQRAR
jgi:hypothetical protein